MQLYLREGSAGLGIVAICFNIVVRTHETGKSFAIGTNQKRQLMRNSYTFMTLVPIEPL